MSFHGNFIAFTKLSLSLAFILSILGFRIAKMVSICLKSVIFGDCAINSAFLFQDTL